MYLRLRQRLARSALVRRLREERYNDFRRACRVRPEDSIIDVGAGAGTFLERLNRENPITALDLLPSNAGHFAEQANVRFVVGDATALVFADQAFDVAFSNSVIEHLPIEQRAAYASEIRRVANRYFVQTPNRYFPIEPHYWLPLVQFLPARGKRWLERKENDGEEIHLLSATDLARLFPDAAIHRERFLGLTKSLIAVRS